MAVSVSRLRLACALGMLLAAGAAAAESRTFANPRIAEHRLDPCLHWGRECGKPAADAWCRSQGFGAAASFQIQQDVGQSYVWGDQRACTDPGCDAFSSVTCEGRNARASSSVAGAAAGAAAAANAAPATTALPGGAPLVGSDTNARLTQLERDVRELFVQLDALKQQQTEMAKSVEFLKQNAVRPVCAKDLSYSMHPVTGEKDFCEGYLCNPAEGICRNACEMSSQCAHDFVCDKPQCWHKSHFQ